MASGQRASTSTVPCLRFEPFVLTSLLCRCIRGGMRAHLPVAARHQRLWLEVPPHAHEKEFLQGDHATSFTRKPRAATPRLLSHPKSCSHHAGLLSGRSAVLPLLEERDGCCPRQKEVGKGQRKMSLARRRRNSKACCVHFLLVDVSHLIK